MDLKPVKILMTTCQQIIHQRYNGDISKCSKCQVFYVTSPERKCKGKYKRQTEGKLVTKEQIAVLLHKIMVRHRRQIILHLTKQVYLIVDGGLF